MKGGDTEVVRLPLIKRMKRKGSPRLYVVPRPGAIDAPRQVSPLVSSGDLEIDPSERILPKLIGKHSGGHLAKGRKIPLDIRKV